MSILIKNMKMPIYGDITIRISPDGTLTDEDLGGETTAHAVELPPHGRLIDADALADQMAKRRNYVGRLSDPLCLIEDAPTIIEAEEGEE